ncbi:MAG: HAMP domain-containing sensor histidine kinase [Thermoanaerobaculia bacterium]
MPLRRRLFLLLGGLISLLLAGQWLLFRSLNRAVTDDVRTVAFRVGEEILSGFSYRIENGPQATGGGAVSKTAGGALDSAAGAPDTARVVVVTAAHAGSAGSDGSDGGDDSDGSDSGDAREPIVAGSLMHPVTSFVHPRTSVVSGALGPSRLTQSAPGAAPAEAGKNPEPRRFVVQHEMRLRHPGTGEDATAAEPFEMEFAGDPAALDDGPLTEPLPGHPPGQLVRKIVLETDAARDVLFVRGPAMKRTIPIPRAAIASTLDRFGTRLLYGNLALLVAGLLAGLLAAAIVSHRVTRPLANLAVAAERLGSGDLGAAVVLSPVASNDEVGRAISAFNRMSQQLATLDAENRRLAAAEHLSELGEVARGLAHSLRNPLNALGLTIEQVGAPAEVVEGSRRQIRRMDGALRSFLALASAGSAQAERVDLAQLAREVALEALQDGAGRVRIEVVTFPHRVPSAETALVAAVTAPEFVVAGVPAELKAALQALVVNAVEASAQGAQVTLRLEHGAENETRIRIVDEGAGLPDAVSARLFEPHVTTKPHGSGMGLFLAHRLISGRYGGRLRLEPGETRGTVATMELGDRLGAGSSERSRERWAERPT